MTNSTLFFTQTLRTLAIFTLLVFTFNSTQAQDCDYCESTAGGQTILCESFEDYYNGYLTPQSNNWARWSYYSDDALVTENRDFHGRKSLKMKREGDYNPDVLWRLGNRTHGKYRLTWKMYVPQHKKAYYSLLKDDYSGNETYEVFFEEDGIGYLQFNQNAGAQSSFYYPYDRWFSVTQLIDLNNNKAELWINGKFVEAWTYNQADFQSSELGAVSFYARQNNEYYVDKLCFTKLDVYSVFCSFDYYPTCVNGYEYYNQCIASVAGYTDEEWTNCNTHDFCENAIVCDNFENYNIYDGIAEQSYDWKKWDYDSRDGDVTDDRYSDGYNSLRIKDITGHDKMDVVLELGNQNHGKYKLAFKMYVEHSEKGYFNLQQNQHDLVGGGSFEMTFNESGNGILKVWGQGEGTFYFPRGEWMDIELYFDTDDNEVRFYLNGEWLYYWSMANYCQVGALNFYAIHNAHYYIDELCFQPVNYMPLTDNDDNTSSYAAADSKEIIEKIEVPTEKKTGFEATETEIATSNTITRTLTVFPNPSRGISTVNMELEQAENVQIVIFNETGQLIKQMDLGETATINETIDITDQNNGMYMIQLIGESFKETQPIVKIQ